MGICMARSHAFARGGSGQHLGHILLKFCKKNIVKIFILKNVQKY